MCLFLGLAAAFPATMAALGIGTSAAGTAAAAGGAVAAGATAAAATTGISALAADAVLVGLAGAGMSAYGSYQSGQAAEKAADYQATLDRQRASMAEKQGFVEQDRADKAYAQQMGQARTSMAAGSVLLDKGSAADWAIGAASEHAAEKSMIAQNAEMAAWGFSSQAALTQYQGKAAAQAGTLNAAGSLLSGAAQAGGMFAKRS